MRSALLLFAAVLAACASGGLVTPADELKLAHKNACGAKGEVQLAMAHMLGESCAEKTARLNTLVHQDQDCLAYFGDAGVRVGDVCEGAPDGAE